MLGACPYLQQNKTKSRNNLSPPLPPEKTTTATTAADRQPPPIAFVEVSIQEAHRRHHISPFLHGVWVARDLSGAVPVGGVCPIVEGEKYYEVKKHHVEENEVPEGGKRQITQKTTNFVKRGGW